MLLAETRKYDNARYFIGGLKKKMKKKKTPVEQAETAPETAEVETEAAASAAPEGFQATIQSASCAASPPGSPTSARTTPSGGRWVESLGRGRSLTSRCARGAGCWSSLTAPCSA